MRRLLRRMYALIRSGLPKCLSHRTFFYVIVILLFQLAYRVLVFPTLYKNVTLFCGDSRYYWYLGKHLEIAAVDFHPSGFPFLLHLLFKVSESPWFLVLINGIWGTLTPIFFFLTAAKFFRKNHFIPFAISIVVFINPIVIIVDSMAYMADTFALFLVSLIMFLYFSSHHRYLRNILFGLLCGYLVIVKATFMYLCPAILGFKVLRIKGPIKHRVLVTLAMFLTFSLIPFWYAFSFNRERVGNVAIENVGGKHVLANVMLHLSCGQLESLTGSPEEREAVRKNCHDPRATKLAVQLFDGNSELNRIERDLQPGEYANMRIVTNGIFRKWVIRAAFKYPSSLFKTIEASLYSYVRRPVTESIGTGREINPFLFSSEPELGGCFSFVSDVFGESDQEYLKNWHTNAEKHTSIFSFLDGFSNAYLRIIDPFLLVSLLFPIGIYCMKKFDLDLIFLHSFTLLYLFLISLGAAYAARYYILFNYLAFLLLSKVISLFPLTRFRPKKDARKELNESVETEA